jgi:RNA polymerase sigma factor (sigma-70 family)
MESERGIFPHLPRGGAAFCTTHWSVVLSAARPGPDGDQQAFARLYTDYWSPLYAYIRRRGHSTTEAEDITQDFFTCLIEKRRLAGLEREGGRFRSFLLKSLDHFLANLWDRAQSQKRGGGMRPLSLNATEGDTDYCPEVAGGETPESLFERQWVFTLLAHVLDRLRFECDAVGKGALFRDLQPHLQGESQGQPYAQIATRHSMSEGAIKVAVHRLRRRYGEMLREEIARTVSTPEEVDEELRHLLSVTAR